MSSPPPVTGYVPVSTHTTVQQQAPITTSYQTHNTEYGYSNAGGHSMHHNVAPVAAGVATGAVAGSAVGAAGH